MHGCDIYERSPETTTKYLLHLFEHNWNNAPLRVNMIRH